MPPLPGSPPRPARTSSRTSPAGRCSPVPPCQRPCIGRCSLGIPSEPFKHLPPVPVRGIRIRGFSFDDLCETPPRRLLVLAGSGEDMPPQHPERPGIVGSRLDGLLQPLGGFAVPAETGERPPPHIQPGKSVLRLYLERLLETLHRLAVVSGLELRRPPLLYRGVCVLPPLTQNITEEIHPTSSAAAHLMRDHSTSHSL